VIPRRGANVESVFGRLVFPRINQRNGLWGVKWRVAKNGVEPPREMEKIRGWLFGNLAVFIDSNSEPGASATGV
jgi:hypothetical protein